MNQTQTTTTVISLTGNSARDVWFRHQLAHRLQPQQPRHAEPVVSIEQTEATKEYEDDGTDYPAR